ncbi:MAG: exodeoxyribonuclease VII small subunit [Clostridia bacterium]|nr:exodeoxyribonuclease VII small subunit [Clostridia bacterium]
MEETKKEVAENAELTFEEALAKLEKIVRQLESGNVPLDHLMQLYDEGNELIKFCSDKLSAAEAKVRVVEEKNGEIAFRDFQE